jgi:CheY-like chemotaxis protein
LVLLDQMMPGIRGIEILRVIRATHSKIELPVIETRRQQVGLR